MDKEQFITAEDLSQRRSCAAYADWLEGKLSKIGGSEEGKRAFREREGHLKEFVCEALPIAIICDRFFERSGSVFVTHVIGSQNFDAIIEDNRADPSGLEYLEITQASENFDSKHRMIYLNTHGSVPLQGDLNVTRGANGQPSVEIGEPVAQPHNQITTKILDDILAAAEKKAVKEYPENTALVVVFDPGPAFKTPEDESLLDDLMNTRALPQLRNFKAVFVSAGDGGKLWRYEP